MHLNIQVTWILAYQTQLSMKSQMTHDQSEHEQGTGAESTCERLGHCFGCVWKKEHLRGTGPEREKGIIGSIQGRKQCPKSVHLGDVVGKEGQNICGQCRSKTEPDWPDE